MRHPQNLLKVAGDEDHRQPLGRQPPDRFQLLSLSILLLYDFVLRDVATRGQGANDPRVKQTESDQIVQAMQERDIPVTYVLYPDEAHGFARPENRRKMFPYIPSDRWGLFHATRNLLFGVRRAGVLHYW